LVTVNAKVTGTGNMYVGGIGSVILNNNANSFTGLLGRQNAGDLTISSIKNSGVASAAGAGTTVRVGASGIIIYNGSGDSTNRTLELFGTGTATLNNNGSGALVWTGPITHTSTANKTFTLGGSNAANNELQGALTDNGSNVLSVTKADAGTWVLSGNNTYTGLTTLSNGTLTLSGNNSGTGGVTLTAGTLNINSATALGASASAFNINGGTIDNTSGSAKTLANNNPITLGGSFSFGTSAGTSANNLTLGTGVVSFGASRTITLNGAGALTFGGVLTNTSAGNYTVTVNKGSGTTSTSAVSFGGVSITASGDATNRTLTFGGDGNINITGAMTNGAGSGTGGLTIANTGTTILSGNNTYTGLTTLSAGTLTLSGNNSGTGGVTLTAGTLNINSATALGASASAFNINGGTIDNTSGSAKTLANNNPITLGGSFSFGTSSGTAANNLNLGTGAVSIGASRTITLNGAGALTFGGVLTNTAALGMTVTVTNGSGTTSTSAVSFGGVSITASGDTINRNLYFYGDGNINVTGSIVNGAGSGTGTLSWGNTGTLTLTGANTYTGTTAIASGVLDAIDGTGLPTNSTLQLRGGVFQSNGTFTRSLGAGATNVNWINNNGGFAARGGALNLQLNNGTSTLYWGDSNARIAGEGKSLIFGSATADNRVDFMNGLNLTNPSATGVATRTITVIDNPNSSADIARISGNIAETTAGMGLLKNGNGTLELTGTNTYTGETLITLGTLQIGAGGTSGSISSSSAITNNGTLAFNRSDTITVSNNIGGTGRLEKTGTGTLVLSGNNTYTGTTTIIGGFLQANHANALGNGGNITFTSGTLQYTANSSATDWGARFKNSTSAIALDTNSTNVILSGAIDATNTGGLTKLGTGTLTLSGSNTYTGTTTISVGTLQSNHANALGNGGNISFTSGTLQYTANSSATDWGARFKNSTSAIALDTNSTNVILSGAIDATNTGGLTKLGTGTLTLSGNNTYTGTTTISVGTLQANHANALGNGGNITFTSGTLQYTANSSATDWGAWFKNSTSAIALDTNSTNVTLSGAIDATNTGGLTKLGTGTLTLSGNNTYTGATSISAGTLAITSTGLLGGGNYSQTIANSGSFLFGSNSNQTLGGIISGSGALTKNGTGTLVLSGNNTYTGTTTISVGTLQTNHANALGSGGNITFTSGTLQYTANSNATDWGARFKNSTSAIALDTNSTNVTLSAAIDTTNTGGLTKLGAGTLMLSGNNTYSGATTISSGTLAITSTGLLGGGNYSQSVANSGTFLFGSNSSQTLSGIISGSGALTKNGTGTLTLSGNNTYTGLTTLSAGTLTLSGNNSGTGGVTLTAGTLNINSATALGASASAFNINGGTIDNTSGSAKTLANNNPITLGGSFSFGTSSGTAANNLNLGTGTVSIGTGRTITLNGAGALTFGGVLTNTATSGMSVTVTNGNGTTSTSAVSFGGVSITASGDATNRSLYLYGDGNINVTGAIVNGAGSGTGTLQCSNTGTVTLTGANTYTGATTINSGVLDAIDGTGVPTSSTIQLKGGVFQSSGTFTRAVANGNGKVNWGGGNSGGFAARGGVLNLQLNNGTSSLTWGNATTQVAGDGFSLIFGSSTADNRVDFQNGLNLGNGTVATRTITVIDNPDSSADIARISGNITETTVGMGLLKDGNGTLELSGNNTYTGATTISAGTLQIGAGGTSGAISSTSGITNNGTLAINRSDALTVSTIISGTGAVTKDGAGTLTLTGNNTYTGATTVNAGTLQAAATRALGNSTVINVNGGSFLVTAENAVNDTAAINLGGGRMAVSGTFNETVGLLTLSANSTIDLAGYNGTLRFSGVGSWAAGTNLAIWNWNGINKYGTPVGDGLNNRHVVFTDATGLDTYLDRISFYSGSGTGFSGSGFAQGFSGGGTEIIAVPETETYFYAVALLAGVVVQYLRRRARQKLLKSHRPA